MQKTYVAAIVLVGAVFFEYYVDVLPGTVTSLLVVVAVGAVGYAGTKVYESELQNKLGTTTDLPNDPLQYVRSFLRESQGRLDIDISSTWNDHLEKRDLNGDRKHIYGLAGYAHTDRQRIIRVIYNLTDDIHVKYDSDADNSVLHAPLDDLDRYLRAEGYKRRNTRSSKDGVNINIGGSRQTVDAESEGGSA